MAGPCTGAGGLTVEAMMRNWMLGSLFVVTVAGAMGLAAPMFVLLGCASVATRPRVLLVPVLALALVIAGVIAHDETRFHRGCTRYETALHRMLVIGNGIAFLCWTHWCFASEVGP